MLPLASHPTCLPGVWRKPFRSRFCIPNLRPSHSKRMKRTSIMCWLAYRKFMTWCDETRTKPSYVKNSSTTVQYKREHTSRENLSGFFCRYVPQKGSPKLMRAWRGPHKIVQVFQDSRVYVLDTGQKVHFERLKPHNSGPLELAATHADSGEVVVLMDPEPERSVDVVDDDKSLPSYMSEQLLSEASDVSLPSRRRHWMDTRLRTKLRVGGSRMHYQQFDYSTSGTDDELSDVMLPVPPNPVDADQVEPEAPPAASDQSISPARILPQLFSDHERVRSPSPQVSSSDKESSLPGTSASLLTNSR